MKTETASLLSAAREVVKPRWPLPSAISYHLPAERNVSRAPAIIIWPGYKEKSAHHLLNFRRAEGIVPIERAEFLEPMLDANEIIRAAWECLDLAQTLDRMAQAIRDQQRHELETLTEEAKALLLAGVISGPANDFTPLLPLIHRMLAVCRACENGSVRPGHIRALASDIVTGRSALNISIESKPQVYGQSVDFIIANTGEAHLHLFAELRGEQASVSWLVMTSKTIQVVAAYSHILPVSRICRTPSEAMALRSRLDTIITALSGGEAWSRS